MLVVAHVIRVVGPRVGRQEELNNEKVMGRTAATRVEGAQEWRVRYDVEVFGLSFVGRAALLYLGAGRQSANSLSYLAILGIYNPNSR